MTLNERLTRWAAAVVLSIGAAAPALGGSVTRPGDTIGLAVGVPLPEGLHIGNTTTYECRDTSPKEICFLVDVPILIWSTQYTIFGARLQGNFGPLVPLRFNGGANNIEGLFNPFGAAQLIWDLGNNWGFSYLLGGYIKTGNEVAYSSASLNQRWGLSYTGNGWDLTANVIWGIQFDSVTDKPQLSPCPVSAAYPHNGCNPDFLNVDLTATKRFGKWEVGPVGLYSTDLNSPVAAYQKQRQVALGGLVGYFFDPVVVQAYVTSDVHQRNYGASAVSANFRFVIPLGNPHSGRPSPPARLMPQ